MKAPWSSQPTLVRHDHSLYRELNVNDETDETNSNNNLCLRGNI